MTSGGIRPYEGCVRGLLDAAGEATTADVRVTLASQGTVSRRKGGSRRPTCSRQTP